MTREEFCPYGSVFLETKDYIFTRYGENEQDLYFKAWSETFENSPVLNDKNFQWKSWEDVLADTNKLQLKIVDKHTEEYIGEVSIMKLGGEMLELGVQLLRKYQGKGIGTRIVNLFVNQLKSIIEAEALGVRIRSDNLISQRMFEKMGAVRIGVEGKEYAELMWKFMQEMGKEKFEEIIKEDFERTQVYTIFYRLPMV